MCSEFDQNIVAKYGAGVNMLALEKEIIKLKSLNFKIENSSGYGEGIYMVMVSMKHDLYGSVLLSMPQSREDGIMGFVRFSQNNTLFNSYDFSSGL